MIRKPAATLDDLRAHLSRLAVGDAGYATSFVDAILKAASEIAASDIHLQPVPDGLEIRLRLDGVLQPLGTFSSGEATDIVTRLKVMAQLLTYRCDIPQEGRITPQKHDVEMRVSTFPTLHGERAVVRLFAIQNDFTYVDDLGFPDDVAVQLKRLLGETSGAVLISGPAGCGKTTTAYACLREIARHAAGQRSLVSLEDPIEVPVDGVSQSQVNAGAGFDLATGLKSLVRQDPEVIFIGEIRDRETAEIAFQASLTGHLMISTFHAGSAAGAISRLSDMGIEPYLLRSGLLAIMNQRLARRLCRCAVDITDPADLLALPVERARRPQGCEDCFGSGYSGRLALVEMLEPDRGEVGRAILSRDDTELLQQRAIGAGMITRWQRALEAVIGGATSPAEVRRVLGFSNLAAHKKTEPSRSGSGSAGGHSTEC